MKFLKFHQKYFKNSLMQILMIICILISCIATNMRPIYADEISNDEVTVVYFYYDYCSACKVSEKTLNSLNEYMKSNNENVHLNIIFQDASNSAIYSLLTEYFSEYKVPVEKQNVPIAFVGDNFFSGTEEIKKGLLFEVNRIDLPETKIVDTSNDKNSSVIKQFSAMQVTSVFIAGLVNGFNPCSLSMYLLLLSLLLVKRVSIKKIGFAFVISKFVTYLLLGSFLYNILSQLKIPWFGVVSKIILLSFVFIIAGINIRDFYFARREKYNKIKMQLPSALRKINHKWIKRAMSSENQNVIIIMSILLGIVITFGEFLCSGQMYLSTIIYVFKNNREFNLTAFWYLIVYDIAFILPLLTITIIIDKTRGVFEVSEKIREKLPLIKLVNAIIFLIFGLIVVVFFN